MVVAVVVVVVVVVELPEVNVVYEIKTRCIKVALDLECFFEHSKKPSKEQIHFFESSKKWSKKFH